MLVVMVAAVSHAAPLNQTYNNDNNTDYIYLFITSVSGPEVNFIEWRTLPGGWTVDIQEDKTLSAYGPEINPGERFRVRFSERGTFTLEWTEMLNGSNIPVGSGSISYNNGRLVGADNSFTSTFPTPVSSTYWLLGSGLIVLIGVRRRFRN